MAVFSLTTITLEKIVILAFDLAIIYELEPAKKRTEGKSSFLVEHEKEIR